MFGRILLTVIVCLGVVVTCQGGGRRELYRKLKACCPSMPTIITRETMKSCKPPKDPRPAGYVEDENDEVVDNDEDPTNGDSEEGGGGRSKRDDGLWMGRKNRSCDVMECAFKKDGYLTTGEDGTNAVDLAALNAKLTSLATGQWEGVLPDIMAFCTETAPDPNPSEACTSGAPDVFKCLKWSMVAKCPDPVQTPECKERLAGKPRKGPKIGRRNRKERRRNQGKEGEEATSTSTSDEDNSESNRKR